MKKFVNIFFTGLLAWLLVGAVVAVQAAPAKPKCDPESTCLTNPLANDKSEDVVDAPVIIGTVIRAALSVIGAITLLMFVVGAQKWLLSAGNMEKVSEGAKTMMWAAIGTLLVFTSYIAVSALTSLITGTK